MNLAIGTLRTHVAKDRGFKFSERLNRELRYSDSLAQVGDRLECIIIKVSDAWELSDNSGHIEISLSDRAEFSETKSIRYTDTATAIENYFPEYFYAQKPYGYLIEALAEKAGFAYAFADSIPYVYDIDRIPDERKSFNALLRLIGINHDFSDYPLRMLRYLIQNYLSIRKYRGTRASILAMMRCMDKKFIEDPTDRCDIEIESIDLPVSEGVTMNRHGAIQIYYENLSPEFSGHAYYMLGKVVPAGLYYRLANRRVKVTDSMAFIDRGYAEDTHIRTKTLSDSITMSDAISYREMAVPERIAFRDKFRNSFEDTAYLGERMKILMRLSDSMAFSDRLGQERRVSDTWELSIAKTKEEHEGKVLHRSDSISLGDSPIAPVTDWYSGIDTDRPSVINWPYTTKTLSPENMEMGEHQSHGPVRHTSDTIYIADQDITVRKDIIFVRTEDNAGILEDLCLVEVYESE